MRQLKIERVKEHSSCIQNKYEDFMLKSYNLTVNATKLADHNNADNLAYRLTFASLKSLNGSINLQKLPGLDYSTDEMFWIILGQYYCSVDRKENIQRSAIQADFPIETFRVNGPLRNNHDFIQTFDCKLGTNMNPDEEKCILN